MQFLLNGARRDVTVPDKSLESKVDKTVLADPENRSQVGASIPGAVSRIQVKKRRPCGGKTRCSWWWRP